MLRKYALEGVEPVRFNHPLIQDLIKLNLKPNDYVIFGSLALFLKGIIPTIGDIDVVTRGNAWNQALDLPLTHTNAELGKAKISKNPVVRVMTENGEIEFFDRWHPEKNWDVNELISCANQVNGINVACLADVIRYKEELGRLKDIVALNQVRNYLETPKIRIDLQNSVTTRRGLQISRFTDRQYSQLQLTA